MAGNLLSRTPEIKAGLLERDGWKDIGKKLVFCVVLLGVVVLICFCGGVVAAKTCGGAVTCDCGDTVTSDYTFHADLTCGAGGSGLTIGADNIKIDGNGYALIGGGGEFTDGIDLDGHDYVTISNLTISGFATDISLPFASNYNTITNNVITDGGIWLSDSEHNEITHNYIHNNYRGIYLGSQSNYNTVFRNTIDDNTYGIWVYDSNSNHMYSNAVCNNLIDDILLSSGTGNYGDNFCDDLNACGGNTISCSSSCDERGCVADANPATVFTCGETVTESCTFNFDLYCTGDGLLIGADEVTIDGDTYYLTGSGSGDGIENNGRDRCTVQDLTIRNFNYGCYFHDGAENNTIEGCTITDSASYGVLISDANNNQLTPHVYFYYTPGGWVTWSLYNHVSDSKWHGIYLFRSDNTLIRATQVTDNGASGIYSYDSHGNTMEGNILRGNVNSGIHLRYSENTMIAAGNSIMENQLHGVHLADASNTNEIEGNEIESNDDDGIHIEDSHHNNIISNNVTANYNGAWLDASANNLIIDNNMIYNTLYGVGVNNSDHNKIQGNILHDNAVGICIKETSNNNNITDNNQIQDNNYGIDIIDSHNTVVRDNAISRHGWNGLYIIDSVNTSVVNNTINDNINEAGTGGTGILVGSSQDTVIYANKITKGWTGIYLSPSAENTTIIENYICNNTNLDIFNQGTDSSGWLNYCDLVDAWNDSGSGGGCMYSCSELNCTDVDGDGYYVYDMLECPIGNDCNDNDASINPGAAEIYCNGIDEDCNGVSDCFCRDADGDGAPALTATCPMGFDCDDSDARIYPGAVEINCNGVDENCDGEDQCDCTDNDGDGYALEGGDCSPGGLVDCNDNDVNIHPNAAEVYCNGIDEDCSGSDDCSCVDNDGDGYFARTWSCPTGTDCDDSAAFIHPGRDEIPYNFIDDNCNGEYDEGCNYSCTSDEDCSYGRTCSEYGTCQCPHGILDFYVGGEHIPICDPVGIPVDTLCEHDWPHREGSKVDYNEEVRACDLYEVTNYGLLAHAEKARDCCVDYINTGVISPGCHAHTDDAYVQSGLATGVNYDNLRRFIGLYELYGMGSEAEYMQHYYYNELDCGCDTGWHGFGFGCLGSTWTEKCCRESHWWCIPSPVCCYDGVHANTAQLKCKEEVGTPSGWASDTDLGANGCCFSDLPVHASTEILSTGTCVDYSVALTTLLRLSGYTHDEVYSARSDCPGDSGHAFNLIRFPGDSKYTLVDTVGNCDGYHPMGLPNCNDCYYWDYENCANDMGRVSCPAKSEVWGTGSVSAPAPCSAVLGNSISGPTVPQNPTFNSTSRTQENVTVTRTVYTEIHIGEIIRVNITIENGNDHSINVTVRDSIAGAVLYDNVSIPAIPAGAIAPPMASVGFSDTIPAHGARSFAYILQPQFVGPYTHYATEVHADDTLIYLDPQKTDVACVSNGVCEGSIGENYVTCPQDCSGGASDGICNPLVDGQCDRDCAAGVDPDCLAAAVLFDTGSGTYPSIRGRHNGTLTLNETITVSRLYTYSCIGTGGHAEHVTIWNSTWAGVEASWDGYGGDWHNITLPECILVAGEPYNYSIETGSYPGIIHESLWNATGGVITCSEFVDANGKRHEGWIPAIQLY